MSNTRTFNTNSPEAQQRPAAFPRWYVNTRLSFLACGILTLVLCISVGGYLLGPLISDIYSRNAIQTALAPLRLFDFACILVAGIFGFIDLWLWRKPTRFPEYAQLLSEYAQSHSEQRSQLAQTNIGNNNLISGEGQGSNQSPPEVIHTNPIGIGGADTAPGTGTEEQTIQLGGQRVPGHAFPPHQELLISAESQGTSDGVVAFDPSSGDPTVPMPSEPSDSESPVSSKESPRKAPASLRFRHYMLPREGDNLERSADKLAFNESSSRYALADGVGTSFLPGKWAEIVAERYVLLHDNFTETGDIVRWLQRCSSEWYEWVIKDWVPRAVKASGQKEWSREITRGAATTFVGCSFSRDELAQKGSTKVHVDVVGDAEFFLVTPPIAPMDRWECKHYYKLHLEDFGQETETIATQEQRVQRDYKWFHFKEFSAQREDCIVLATDALAQWILRQIDALKERQVDAPKDPWEELLSISNKDEFKRFVMTCRLKGEMEVDDTTVMIIPLSGYSSVTK